MLFWWYWFVMLSNESKEGGFVSVFNKDYKILHWFVIKLFDVYLNIFCFIDRSWENISIQFLTILFLIFIPIFICQFFALIYNLKCVCQILIPVLLDFLINAKHHFLYLIFMWFSFCVIVFYKNKRLFNIIYIYTIFIYYFFEGGGR